MGFPRQEYWSGVPLPSPSSILKIFQVDSVCIPSNSSKIFNFNIFLNRTLGLILRRLKFYTLSNHLSLLYSVILSNMGHISSQNTFVYQYSKLNLFELIFNSQMRNKSKKKSFYSETQDLHSCSKTKTYI